jgi:hypothetical protein
MDAVILLSTEMTESWMACPKITMKETGWRSQGALKVCTSCSSAEIDLCLTIQRLVAQQTLVSRGLLKWHWDWNYGKWSNHLVIGSGRCAGVHVTRFCDDTCSHWQETPATQSSRWYRGLRIYVTF